MEIRKVVAQRETQSKLSIKPGTLDVPGTQSLGKMSCIFKVIHTGLERRKETGELLGNLPGHSHDAGRNHGS